jgi:hypothetical protein
MTTFEIIRNIFAVIGLIAVFCGISAFIYIRLFGIEVFPADEHAQVKNARG